MFKRSIKFRLLFVMGVASIITISAIILAYVQLVNHAKRTSGEKLHQEVKQTASIIEKFVDKNAEAFHFVSKQVENRNDLNQIQSFLKKYAVSHDHIAELNLLDQNGVVTASSNESLIGKNYSSYSDSRIGSDISYSNAQNHSMSEMYIQRNNEAKFYNLSKEIKLRSDSIGATLIAHVNSSQIKNQLVWLDQMNIGDEHSYIINTDGAVLVSTNTESNFKGSFYDSEFSFHSKNKKEGFSNYTDNTDKAVITGFAKLNFHLGNDELTLVSITSENDVLKSINAILLRAAIVIGLCIVVCLFSIWFIFSKLARKLYKLSKVSKQIAQGNLAAELPSITSDDVGVLTIEIANLQERLKSIVKQAETISEGDYSGLIAPMNNDDQLGEALSQMTTSLSDSLYKNEQESWLKNTVSEALSFTLANYDLDQLVDKVLSYVSQKVNAGKGAMYLADIENNNENDKYLLLKGAYAFKPTKDSSVKIKYKEGLVGQVAFEKNTIILNDIPADYVSIDSSLGNGIPSSIVAVPIVFQEKLLGVIELATFNSLSEIHLQMIEAVASRLGASINNIQNKENTDKLLQSTQEVARQLVEQQRALQISNQELTEQTDKLKESEQNRANLQLEMQQQIDTLNEAAIMSETDAEGNITYVNDKFCEISGYSREELIGQNHRILKSGKQSDAIFKSLWETISSGKVWKGKILNKKKGDAGEFWVETTIMPFKNLEGEIIKYVAIKVDVTDLEEQKKSIKLAEKLKVSEEELRVQQEELAQANVELEEKAQQLEEYNKSILAKNESLYQAQDAFKQKAEELEVAGKYKSEFLSNMSHELRTPLNSILVLTKLLQDNADKNLNDEQLEYASIINKSGTDLLNLINEVLDLAKIESGKISIEVEPLNLKEFVSDTADGFKAISMENGINFDVQVGNDLPKFIDTDSHRLKQIMKNLLSNAFKFTEKEGTVGLHVSRIESKSNFSEPQLRNADEVVEIAVEDTGIGIAEDKIAQVFEAFKQADGTTERKYGGTGLGLSISKELAKLLGGELSLTSVLGEGSRFVLHIPFNLEKVEEEDSPKVHNPEEDSNITVGPEGEIPEIDFGGKGKSFPSVVDDDRDNFTNDDELVLIVEDDESFAKVLLKFARKQGYKGIIVTDGSYALPHVEAYNPSAILLDIQLPNMDGWNILKKLKSSQYAHIPVHIMSGNENEAKGIELGAISYMVKPVSTSDLEFVFSGLMSDGSDDKTVLVVEDNRSQSLMIRDILKKHKVRSLAAFSAREAKKVLGEQEIDIVVLDIGLPDSDDLKLLEEIKAKFQNMPVVIFTGRDLTEDEISEINSFNNTSIVLKGGNSTDRIIQETELFLHHIENKKTQTAVKPVITQTQEPHSLEGRKILIVDDDMRNIYTLKAIFKKYNLEITTATNGVEAIEAMNADPSIELVLMDIMMPEMDGYEATRNLRGDSRFEELPIIALTAKAMKGDREKCIEAGASDYITKPVDVDKLMSLMRVWLYGN